MSSPPSTIPSSEPDVPLASDAEPGPFWSQAKQLWGIAWEFHWVGFGVLFSALAVRTFIALAQVKTKRGFGRKPLFIAINALLLVLGTTRALYLFLDPYSSRDNGVQSPGWLAKLLFGITFPCLTSSFCLIHLAFVEVTKIQLGSRRLQSIRFLSGIIVTHFVVVITAETTTAIKPKYAPMLIVCHSFSIIWGFVLSTSFIYSGLKVIHHANRVQKQLNAIELGKAAGKVDGKRRKTRTSKVAKITFATSVLGFACCGLQIYSMFGVYSLYSKVVNPSPWPWWVFQTCFRLVEFSMACTIAYSVTQPSPEQQIKTTAATAEDKFTTDVLKCQS